MARVEGGAVIIDTDWPGLKNQIDTRNINFKYEEDATAYEIFAIDGQYFYKTVIYKAGQAPENQATYDTWRAEFEADYKPRVTDFNSTQPIFLTTIDGYSVVLKDGATPTANDGYGVAMIGYDGSNYRMARTDSSGRQVSVGAGVAGTPAGGVFSIQGVAGGTAIPISGSITADNDSVGLNDGAIPDASTLIGGSDGTNIRPLRVFDVDTGGGQQWVLGVGLRKASGGGSVELGTSSDPIRIDPTGTTTQPISGTVTANQGGAWTVAATQSGTWTVQPGNTANTTPWLITINQGGNSATVTASNALKIDGSAVTQPVSGTVTANAGTGDFTVVQPTASNLNAQVVGNVASGNALAGNPVRIGASDGTNVRNIFSDTSGRLIVVGGAASGAAVSGNPVLMAGSDGVNARTILTASDGTVRIDPTGTTTQPVSGTVAATQSGTWTVQPGNTANTTPWLATINQGGNSATVTASNALKVDGSAVTQPVSGTVTANAGTGDFTVVQSTASNLRAQTSSESNTGTTVPTQASMVGGSDGTNLRAILVDISGRQVVIGAAADGATVSGNPILIAGSDGTNARSIRTATDGTVRIDPTGTTTQPISGTVTANQGTSPWVTNVTQFGSSNVVTGTGASGSGIPRVTVSNDSNILATQSGTWTVQQGTPPWSVVGPGADGAALSGNPVRVAGSDGTNTQDITTDTSGRLLVSGAAADGTAVTGNPVLIAGQDGTNVQSISTDPAGNQYTVNYGAPSNATRGLSFGRVTGIGNALQAIRSTIYNQQSANAQRSMASNSAADNSAGIGARTVKITYYTATMTGPFTETITMNGTTPVNTVASNICFIEKMEVMSVGSNNSNVGIITLYVSTGGAGGIIGNIGTGSITSSRGDNQTLWAHHYVASGITVNITSYAAGSNGNQGAASFLMALDPTSSTSPEKIVSDAVAAASSTMSVVRNLIVPIRILGPSRVTLYVVPLGNNTQFFGGFDFWEL
jgi:hypothetical protein